MKFTITLSLGDGYKKTVEVEQSESMPSVDLPEYGEPGYDSGRKAPAMDWAIGQSDIAKAIDGAIQDFWAKFEDVEKRDYLKVQRINNAKGVLPIDAQIERDAIDKAVAS